MRGAEFEHNVFLVVDKIEQHIDDKDFIANRMWAKKKSLC